jgi:hypothetical protein
MTEPLFVQGTLPSSGSRFRMWVSLRWAVLEVNGLVTFVPSSAGSWDRHPLPAELVADMAVALWEAGQP